MSAAPVNITQWLQQLPIPWLASNPVGRADVTSYGTVLDGQVDLLRQAVKARMPLIAPADALPHIGGDRALIQGPSESNTNFAIRVQDAWGAWSRAGQPAELLEQLYWDGFPGAMLVQQNGLAYSLSGSPTAGVDPTTLLVTTTLSANPTISGAPPWWMFDTSDSFCSRFAVVFPGSTFPPSMATADLTRLRVIISRWRPAEATCVGIYELTSGRFWGWPIATWGSGLNWGPSTSVAFTP